jgi:hypothetical protein
VTSIQLRYTGPAPGFWWLVTDLRNAGYRAVHVPIDHLLADIDLIADLVRLGSGSDDEQLDLDGATKAIATFRKRFASVDDEPPHVRLVGVELHSEAAYLAVLRDPSLHPVVRVLRDKELESAPPTKMRPNYRLTKAVSRRLRRAFR